MKTYLDFDWAKFDLAITISVGLAKFLKMDFASGIGRPLMRLPLTLTISSPTVKRPSLKLYKTD